MLGLKILNSNDVNYVDVLNLNYLLSKIRKFSTVLKIYELI